MMVKDYDTCTDEELIARLRAGEREITDYLNRQIQIAGADQGEGAVPGGRRSRGSDPGGHARTFKAVRDYKPGKEASFATFAGLCIDRQMYSAVASSQRQKHQPLNSYISLYRTPESGDRELLELIEQPGGDPEERFTKP